VAIEQRTSRGGRKSTVATMTEIHHFLRLLYVKLGTQMCPTCDVPVESQTADQIVAALLRDLKGRHIGLLAPLVVARKGYYTDLAKWAGGKGHSHLRVDGEFIPTANWPRLDRYREHTIELPVADLLVSPNDEASLRLAVSQALEHGKGSMSVLVDVSGSADGPLESRRNGAPAGDAEQRHYSIKRVCPCCGENFPEPDPRMFSYNSKHGWCTHCYGTGLEIAGFDETQTGEESSWTNNDNQPAGTCAHCHGQRLNPIAL